MEAYVKWENFIVSIATDVVFPEGWIAILDHYGKQGWELVTIRDAFVYFKRPIRSKSEAEILKHFDERQSLT